MKINKASRYSLQNFINLTILKRKPSHSDFVSLDIGFTLEPEYIVWLSKLKKSINLFKKELLLSPFFKEFGGYNFIFMIFFVSSFLFVFLVDQMKTLNDLVPINLIGNNDFDLLIDKNFLLLIPFMYLLFLFLLITLFYKYNFRFVKIFLNISFFYIFFASIVLFFGIVRYMLYF